MAFIPMRVYFAAECDPDGNCPKCHTDFGDCECSAGDDDDDTEPGLLDALPVRRNPIPTDLNDEND